MGKVYFAKRFSLTAIYRDYSKSGFTACLKYYNHIQSSGSNNNWREYVVYTNHETLAKTIYNYQLEIEWIFLSSFLLWHSYKHISYEVLSL